MTSGIGEGVSEAVAVTEGDCDEEGVRLLVTEGGSVREAETPGGSDWDAAAVALELEVGLAVAEGLAVSVAVCVASGEGSRLDTPDTTRLSMRHVPPVP
jgi:hypothetical protein